MNWHRIETDVVLSSGEKFVAKVEGREVLICRIGDDYFGLASRCTHAAWPLVGEPLEGNQIVCSLHGARFDIRDGCPTLGPASKPLTTYPVEMRGDNLYVSLSK